MTVLKVCDRTNYMLLCSWIGHTRVKPQSFQMSQKQKAIKQCLNYESLVNLFQISCL